MAFWESLFIIFSIVVAGLILSLTVIFIITGIKKRAMFQSQKHNKITNPQALSESVTIPVAIKSKPGEQEDKLEELLRNHKKPESVSVNAEAAKTQNQSLKADICKELESNIAVSIKPIGPAENKPEKSARNRKKVEGVGVKVLVPKTMNQSSKSDIFKELESNLTIAIAPWGGKLIPFQTTFWDGDHLKVEPFLVNNQEEITQAYIDIRLANSLVWLSKEVGHQSVDLDKSYKQLCAKIAERLIRIITLPENVK